MSRYLVTGGAGFIGSHLVEALVSRGERVRILDDFSTGKPENLERLRRNETRARGIIELLEGDIRDDSVCRRAVEEVTVVFHQAALGSVPRSVEDPMTTEQVNVIGTLNLLLASRDAGVRRFVVASSSSVYGDSPSLPKHEGMPCDPRSPYALSKLAAERYAILFHALYGLPTIALRYFNVFGPRQDPTSQYAAVVPRFTEAILDGRSPTVYGTGEQTRDFTYVGNAVAANLAAENSSEESLGKTYNVACGRQISLIELLKLLAGLAAREVEPVFEPARAGDVMHSLASVERAERYLSYRPEIGLEEGLRRTVQHALAAREQ